MTADDTQYKLYSQVQKKKNINGIAIIIISLQMSNQSILAFDTESEYDSDATFLIND